MLRYGVAMIVGDCGFVEINKGKLEVLELGCI